MSHHIYTRPLVTTASTTNKMENQDATGYFEGNNFTSLFLADGLGSVKYAKKAAEAIISSFTEHDSVLDKEENIDAGRELDKSFAAAKQKLIACANKLALNVQKTEGQFASTAIKIVETNDKIIIAYAGNGSVWHIRGNFTKFSDNYLFPWNAINYLNPHTLPENGKEMLYKLISDSDDDGESKPTIVTINKDPEYGEIIMACTDGIYSADQVRAGKNEMGIWLKLNIPLLRFFDQIKIYFRSNKQYNHKGLQVMVEEYLSQIKQMISDDASIGVLVTKEALNYQHSTHNGDHADYKDIKF